MADQYTASMFGLDSPYWKDKYGWDFQRDERYPEKLDDLQENRLLAEGLNMAGITPDMDLGDIRKKYKSEFKGVSNEEIHSFLDDVFTKAGIDTGFTYGDANSMFRKVLHQKGMLREPGKKDWPTIDIPYWRDPPASIDPGIWDEKMRRDGEVVETVDWVGPRHVRKMANGGLINGTNGNIAIVGEAGPELVKVNNGEAEVIPLSDDVTSWASPSGIASTNFPWENMTPSFDHNFGVSQKYNPNIHYTSSGDELYDTGSTFNLEKKTTDEMPGKKEPPYGNRALLQKVALDSYDRLQNMFWDKYKKPIPLESAFRNLDHNEALRRRGLKPSKYSKHMEGLSIDVSKSRLTSKEWQFLKDNAPRAGFRWNDYKTGSKHFDYIPEWDAMTT